MDTYRTVGKGILYLFIGRIITLFSGIPFLGVIIMIAGTAVSLYGLYMMAQAESGYQPALILTVAWFIISLLTSLFFKNGFIGGVFNLIASVLSFMVTFYICNTTGRLLQGIDNTLAERAATIWKLFLVCTIIIVICSMLAVIPIINILAMVVTYAIAIVQLVAAILYLIFLWQSQKVLQR